VVKEEETKHYHLGKANMVADALSQKSHCNSMIVEDSHVSYLLHPAILHNISFESSLHNQVIELLDDGCGDTPFQKKD